MKLSVNKATIIDGLQKAANIIPAKSGGAFIRSIWLKAENDRLSIMTTDANIEFTGNYQAEVTVPGLIGVQGRVFVDLVRQLPAGILQLSLDKEGNTLLVEQGKRRYKLPVTNPDWFQNFSEFPEKDSIMWTGDFFGDILDRVSFCISDEESQEAMACLYFKPCGNGRVDVCGLDGHQFALVSFVHDDLCARLPEKGLLIQKKYIQDIKKWLGPDEIELNYTDKKFYLKRADGMEILSLPRVEHEYPDYNVFMSKLNVEDLSVLHLSRKEAVEALGRSLVFNTASQSCVFMDLTENELSLSVDGGEGGSSCESLEVEYKGTISRIAFPTKRLMEIFGHFVSDVIDMQFTETEGPCAIKGADENQYTVIIMPMKIAEKVYYKEEDL